MPRCAGRALPGSRFCVAHRPPDPQRVSEHSSLQPSGSSWRWRRIREQQLRDHPVCQRCCRRVAEVVDHLVPRVQGGNDDPSNLRSLCGDCHAASHRGRRSAAVPPADPPGPPGCWPS